MIINRDDKAHRETSSARAPGRGAECPVPVHSRRGSVANGAAKPERRDSVGNIRCTFRRSLRDHGDPAPPDRVRGRETAWRGLLELGSDATASTGTTVPVGLLPFGRLKRRMRLLVALLFAVGMQVAAQATVLVLQQWPYVRDPQAMRTALGTTRGSRATPTVGCIGASGGHPWSW